MSGKTQQLYQPVAMATAAKHVQNDSAQMQWEDMVSSSTVQPSSRDRGPSTIVHHSVTLRVPIQSHIDSLWLQSFLLLLVIFGFVLAVSSIIPNDDTVRTVTLIIIIIYCIEIALRIFAFGPKRYFKSILNIIDFVAVLGTHSLSPFMFNVD